VPVELKTQSGSVSMVRDVKDLGRLNSTQLDQLYAAGVAENIPDGTLDGSGIAMPGSWIGRAIGKLFHMLVWRGKVFFSQSDTIKNRIGPFGNAAIQANVALGESLIDGQQSIIVEYPFTFFGKKITDEIRKVGPGIYLGRGTLGGSHVVYFSLSETPVYANRKYYSGKVALVTGGASGFGRCLCESLARRGATVIVTDINPEQISEVVDVISADGGEAYGLKLDTTDAQVFNEVITDVTDTYGRIDMLFNNAGISVGGEFRDISPAHHHKVMDVNVTGVLNGVHAVLPTMLSQSNGHIINTSSISGLTPTPLGAVYAASKHAVLGLSTSLQPELRSHGVKVSAICPGPMRTPFFEKSPTVGYDLDKLNDSILFRNKAEPKPCVEKALDEVARNTKIIIVGPAATGVMWKVYRWFPNAAINLCGRIVKNMGSLREDSQPG